MTYANPFDWVSPSISAFLLVSGTLFFPGCFWLQQYWLKKTSSGRAFIKTHQLTEKDTIDISNKIVSAIQALCAGVSGVIVVSHCHRKVLNCRQTVAIGYAWFGIPYFMYDTLCMFYVFTFTKKAHSNAERLSTTKYLLMKIIEFGQFAMYSPVIFIHHVVMAHVGWTLILFYRDAVEPGDFFVGVMYMMEFSTPFVSIRFILSKLKMKSSIWYRINGAIMLTAFPIFRIYGVVHAALLFTWQNNHPNIFQGIMGVPWHWRTIWMIAMIPQLYWYFLMVRGLVKMYSEKEPKLKQRKEDQDSLQEPLFEEYSSGTGSGGDRNCNENTRRTDIAESDEKCSTSTAIASPNAMPYSSSTNSNDKLSNVISSKLD